MKNVEPGATIYHDDYRSYNSLDGLFKHDSVNHSQHEYARGAVHINTAEAEFSVFRPWIRTYRGVSKEKLYLYCSHYQFLRNNRRVDRIERALSMFGLSSSSFLGANQEESGLDLCNPEAILPVAFDMSARG
jgi:transposase-like protein